MPIVTVTQPADGTNADAADINDQINAILAVLNGSIDADNIAAGGVGTSELADLAVTPAKLSSDVGGGWFPGLAAPSSITQNGNRSYTIVFSGVDYSSILSRGQRLLINRTVASPTQCTSLNGSTQYFSKASPNKLSFTDDFVVYAWIKLTSYAANASIASRYNGTSGFQCYVNTTGQLNIQGFNAGAANFSQILSSQSIPLNKWVHVALQLDMSSFTATSTTSYVMIDGVDVPAVVSRGGTNPTALVQAGNLEIGATNGGTLPFSGKLAQVAIFNAKVTQATIRSYMGQTLSGSETSLASAYSFNNSIADLNTSTPNDLTASGSAVATNSDSPFSLTNAGVPSGSKDYAVIQSVSFSTDTTVVAQAPEGNTLPTTGGVTSIYYSGLRTPYGFIANKNKWVVETIGRAQASQVTAVAGTWYQLGSIQLSVPIGEWYLGYWLGVQQNGTAGTGDVAATCATTTAAETDVRFTAYATANSAIMGAELTKQNDIAPTTTTIYYLNSRVVTALAANTLLNRGDQMPTIIRAELANL